MLPSIATNDAQSANVTNQPRQNDMPKNESENSKNEITNIVKNGLLAQPDEAAQKQAPGSVDSAPNVSVYSDQKGFGTSKDESRHDSSQRGDSKKNRTGNNNSKGSHHVSGTPLYGNNFQAVAGDGAKIRDDNSNGFKQNVSGDADNGSQTKVQTGAWSSEGTKKDFEGNGGALGAYGSAGVGAQGDAGVSKSNDKASIDARGTGWTGAQGRGSAGTGIGTNRGAFTQAGGEARIGVGGDGEVKGKFGPKKMMEAGATGYTMVGAETSNGFFAGSQILSDKEKAAGLTGKTGLNASARGFAGAKAGGGVSTGVNGNTLGANGAVYAGVGAESKFGVSMETDKNDKKYLNVGGKVGAAMGVGGSVGGDIRINVTPIVKAGEAIADKTKPVIDDIGDGVKNTANKVKDGTKDAAYKVKDTFKSVFG
jgi:hypothetical protein